MRVVVFRRADPDFFLPHVNMTRIAEYTAVAATSGGPDDISLGALYWRLSEARPVTIALLEGRARGAGGEFRYACWLTWRCSRWAWALGELVAHDELHKGPPPGLPAAADW